MAASEEQIDMAYSAEISRANPSCFLFVIDQSGSMNDPVGGGETGKRKADGVSDAVNRLLQELTLKCVRAEGQVWDYYSVGVVGYGAAVGPAFGGALSGRDLVPISQIADNPVRIDTRTKKVDDGAGGLVDKSVRFPIWFDPVSNGGTPMCQALGNAQSMLSSWLAQHPTSFPPVVIQITDGESTDGDPSGAMRAVTDLASTDGNVLLFNLHLSSTNSRPISFPDSAAELPDQYSRMLFDSASRLTPFMRDVAARDHGLPMSDGSKAFVFNADLTLVVQALDIGTRPSNLR